jgi:hypothetical protein
MNSTDSARNQRILGQEQGTVQGIVGIFFLIASGNWTYDHPFRAVDEGEQGISSEFGS